MRNTFVHELIERARIDNRIFLVVGDLGYSVVEPFRDRFPSRFLNVGVAEQNMTGIAAGLAREGFKVFTYSIANFPTLRCLEQVRNDVCHHDLDVTVVAVGGGFMYGALGPSHYATEDIGILRVLPRMRLFAPGVPEQLPAILDEIAHVPGPAYLRLGRAAADAGGKLAPFSGGWLGQRTGATSAVVLCGNVAAAASRLVSPAAQPPDRWIAGRLKPIPGDVIEALACYTDVNIVEDHQRIGGVYSILAEVLYGRAAKTGRPLLFSYAIPDVFPDTVGKEAILQEAMIRPPEGGT